MNGIGQTLRSLPPGLGGGLATGAAIGSIAGAVAGAVSGQDIGEQATIGAGSGGAAGALIGAIAAALSSGDEPERLRHAITAVWETAAAFAGTAGSLAVAFPTQKMLVSTATRCMELDLDRKLTPLEKTVISAFLSGAAWSALSPPVGAAAAGVFVLSKKLADAFNLLARQMGQTDVILRVSSPGHMMKLFDYMALSFLIGPSIKGALGSMAALSGNAIPNTHWSAFEATPWGLASPTGVAIACTLAYLSTGLAERKNGGIAFAKSPAMTLQAARDALVSRIVAMSRSGLVQTGAIPGLAMWTLKELIAGSGGLLEILFDNDAVTSTAAGLIMGATICSMAREWFSQIMVSGFGPPGNNLYPQLEAAHRAGLHVQADRLTASLAEAEAERDTSTDGGLANEILRDTFEAVTALFTVGCALNAMGNPDGLTMEDAAIQQMMEVSAQVGLPAMGVGLVFQLLAIRAAAGPLTGRDDPHSRRSTSALVAMTGGAAAALVASTSAVGWGVLPAVAVGAGAGALANHALRAVHVPGWVRSSGHYPAPEDHPPLAMDGLEPMGRGREEGEGFFGFQSRVWKEALTDLQGRPDRSAPARAQTQSRTVRQSSIEVAIHLPQDQHDMNREYCLDDSYSAEEFYLQPASPKGFSI